MWHVYMPTLLGSTIVIRSLSTYAAVGCSERIALFFNKCSTTILAAGPAIKPESSGEDPLKAQLAHLRQNKQDRDVVIIVDGLDNVRLPL